MLVAVQKDVTESVPDLARGAQDVEMVAIGDHRAPARKDPVHGPSDPGRDGFHAAAERIVVASFDDQVNVVALDGVVSEPRRGRVTECGEGRFERTEPAFLPAPRRCPPHLEWGIKGSDICCESTVRF